MYFFFKQDFIVPHSCIHVLPGSGLGTTRPTCMSKHQTHNVANTRQRGVHYSAKEGFIIVSFTIIYAIRFITVTFELTTKVNVHSSQC